MSTETTINEMFFTKIMDCVRYDIKQLCASKLDEITTTINNDLQNYIIFPDQVYDYFFDNILHEYIEKDDQVYDYFFDNIFRGEKDEQQLIEEYKRCEYILDKSKDKLVDSIVWHIVKELDNTDEIKEHANEIRSNVNEAVYKFLYNDDMVRKFFSYSVDCGIFEHGILYSDFNNNYFFGEHSDHKSYHIFYKNILKEMKIEKEKRIMEIKKCNAMYD